MNFSQIIRHKAIVVILLLTFLSVKGYSQLAKIDWGKDSVSNDNATKSKERFHATFQGGRRKTTRTVTFNTEELKALIDEIYNIGDSVVQFQFALLREEDTARYISRHPELTDGDKNDLVNRPILLIRIPREVISKRNFGGSANSAASGSVYMSIGKICPPPKSCKD